MQKPSKHLVFIALLLRMLVTGKEVNLMIGKKFVSLSALTLFAFTLTLAGCEKKEETVRRRHRRLRLRHRLRQARGSTGSARSTRRAGSTRRTRRTGTRCASGEERRRKNQVRIFSLIPVDATKKGEGFDTFPFFAILLCGRGLW